jgi:hypothetical protein
MMSESALMFSCLDKSSWVSLSRSSSPSQRRTVRASISPVSWREGELRNARTGTSQLTRRRHSQGIPRSTPSYAPSFPPLSTGLQYPPGYDPTANQHASIPYHRLFVSNIASTLNRDDIYQVFEAFGEIVFVDLQHHMVRRTMLVRWSR